MGSEIYPEVHENPRAFFSNSSPILLKSSIQYPWGLGLHHIPIEIFNLSNLTNLLDLSQNSLSGNIPKEVDNLKNLDWLDMSENHLTGDIPKPSEHAS